MKSCYFASLLSVIKLSSTEKTPVYPQNDSVLIMQYKMVKNGTPARTRTVDILIKSEALYQLSYGRIPKKRRLLWPTRPRVKAKICVKNVSCMVKICAKTLRKHFKFIFRDSCPHSGHQILEICDIMP